MVVVRSNPRLIWLNLKKPVSCHGLRAKISLFLNLFLNRRILSFFAVCCLLTFTGKAQATILSTVTDLIWRAGSQLNLVSEEKIIPTLVSSANSQNMALLEASVGNLDSGTASTKPELDLPIVNGGAVLAEVGPMGTVADLTEGVPPTDQISVYTVHPGDSLSGIAKMYGVSVNTIRWANDLTKNSVIKEGQTLVILPISGIQYTVKKGDTIKSIAKKYSGETSEIIAYNGLDVDKGLVAGEIIIIPDGELGLPAAKSPAGGTSSGGKYKGPSYPGYYMRPIVGGVKTQGLHGYNAVDLAAPYGTPVYAAASGRVIVARPTGYNGGYGGYLVISHPNGTQTLYSHCSSLAVYSGQNVGKGDVVGYIGSTGRSTGNHLHFEVRGAANPF